jgi:hypothetical protein
MREPRRHFWSNLWAVAYKEAAVLRHDRPFLAVVFVQPIMMMIIFSAVSNRPANVPWTVLDRSHTTVSRRLVEEIGVSGYFLPPVRSRSSSSRATSRATSSAGGRACKCCSTARIHCRRRASAASSHR